MTENRQKPGRSIAEILDTMGLEMIKGNSRLFPKGGKIYLLGPKLIPVTITSEHGFTGNRLKRKKGKEGRTHLEVEGQVVELPDLEVKKGDLNRYVLLDEEAFIDDTRFGTDGNNRVTEGFLFWG